MVLKMTTLNVEEDLASADRPPTPPTHPIAKTKRGLTAKRQSTEPDLNPQNSIKGKD